VAGVVAACVMGTGSPLVDTSAIDDRARRSNPKRRLPDLALL
jgi:hypothetical protein